MTIGSDIQELGQSGVLQAADEYSRGRFKAKDAEEDGPTLAQVELAAALAARPST